MLRRNFNCLVLAVADLSAPTELRLMCWKEANSVGQLLDRVRQ